MIKALKIEPEDKVAVLLSPINRGEACQIEGAEIRVNQDIPFGHKVAVVEINKGEAVIKYGEIIGSATEDIKIGDWVHTHNLRSERGRLQKEGDQ